MAQCINHPQYPAVERCEKCGVPLCGLCLWYAESGERLCERCAQEWQASGQVVHAPSDYADGIRPTLLPQPTGWQQETYTGNGIDLAGLIAACMGAMVLLSCIPCFNTIIPFLGALVGLAALAGANQAANPRRTRILAGIGIGGSVVVILTWGIWMFIFLVLPLMMAAISGINPNP